MTKTVASLGAMRSIWANKSFETGSSKTRAVARTGSIVCTFDCVFNSSKVSSVGLEVSVVPSSELLKYVFIFKYLFVLIWIFFV